MRSRTSRGGVAIVLQDVVQAGGSDQISEDLSAKGTLTR